eukprot:scaffold168003_cov33-Tisochrysis_lutea.AAC.4
MWRRLGAGACRHCRAFLFALGYVHPSALATISHAVDHNEIAAVRARKAFSAATKHSSSSGRSRKRSNESVPSTAFERQMLGRCVLNGMLALRSTDCISRPIRCER